MSHRRPALVVAVLTVGFALTACGSGDDPFEPPAAESSASSSSAAPDVDYATIEIPEEYGGGTLPIPPGTTPGEPMESDGQLIVEFDGIDKEEGVAFYAEALPAVGFTIDFADDLAVSARDETREVSAGLGSGPDGVRLIVEPVS